MSDLFLESMPIAAVYVCIALVILAACEIGFKIGSHHHRTLQDKEAPTSVGPMVGGLLGMLAFVLAFTFSLAASQHTLRRENVLTEANRIGTAYLRSDLIDEQKGTEVKRLLREYVDIRLQAARPGGDWQTAVKRSLEIHDLLWAQVASAAIDDPNEITSLVVQSVNDVIDMHEQRLTGAIRSRIPGSVWIGLMAITVLAMLTIGLQAGLAGKRRMVAVLPLSLAFAVLVTLIVDLNRPYGGLITVGQQAMVDLQNTMNPATK